MRLPISILAIVVADLGAFSCGFAGCGVERHFADPTPASYSTTRVTVRADGLEDTVEAARVTRAFFDDSGAVPMLGRAFTPDEYRDAATGVVMISADYWKKRLGASPEIIGRQIAIDGRPRTIVGIGPPHFSPKDTQIWMPGR